MDKVIKGQAHHVQISTFGSAGSSPIAKGSAYVTEQASNTKYAGGVTFTTSSVEGGVSKITVATNATTLYDYGKKFDVWLNSASVDGQMINAVVDSFEIDTHIVAEASVASANASTIVSDFSVKADGLLVGGTIRVIRGTGAPSPAHIIIASSASPANRFKVTPTFGAVPATSDTVQFLATEYVENLSVIPANVIAVNSVSITPVMAANWTGYYQAANATIGFHMQTHSTNLSDIITDTGTTGVLIAASENIATSAQVSSISSAVWAFAGAEPTVPITWSSVNKGQIQDWLGFRGVARHHVSDTELEVYSSGGAVIASASIALTSTSANQDQFLG